jgi:ABC-2 type transport system ATP-binding protein
MTQESALTLTGVFKRFGKRVALDGASLRVPKGSICGLVGPNGAGKTTAFGVVGGWVQADQGGVNVLGEGVFDPWRHKGRLSVLPQDAELNPHMPVRTLLEHLGRLQGMSQTDAVYAAAGILDEVELTDRGGERVAALSHGMRRRVAVAQALMGKPELVLLDEPTNGLDPELVVRIREVLRKRRGRVSMLVSSHVLSELEATCDEIVFMEAGRVVRQGSLEEITGRSRRVRYEIRELSGVKGALAKLGEALGGGRLRGVDAGLVCEPPKGMAPEEVNRRLLPLLLEYGLIGVAWGDRLEEAWMERQTAVG